MAAWPLPPEIVFWVAQFATPLHARHAWRLPPLLRGVLFAKADARASRDEPWRLVGEAGAKKLVSRRRKPGHLLKTNR
jgi:hypothetical protein